MAEKKKKNEPQAQTRICLLNGDVLYGEIVSQSIRINKGLFTLIFVKTSDLIAISGSVFSKKATIKLKDGSRFVGKLGGSVELRCSDDEIVKIKGKEIFAIQTRKE